MPKVVFVMAMSLDGFVNDDRGRADWLYPDIEALNRTPLIQEMAASTGAVVMGRRTFEMPGDPDWYADHYVLRAPIVVVTTNPPPRMPRQAGALTFSFVEGPEAALRNAKVAAGDKQVTVVGGPTLGQSLLRAGMVDELQLAIMPVLLGGGMRLFEHLEDQTIAFEKVRVIETGDRTDIVFRVRRRTGR
jgi:dihydrofolate reductase